MKAFCYAGPPCYQHKRAAGPKKGNVGANIPSLNVKHIFCLWHLSHANLPGWVHKGGVVGVHEAVHVSFSVLWGHAAVGRCAKVKKDTASTCQLPIDHLAVISDLSNSRLLAQRSPWMIKSSLHSLHMEVPMSFLQCLIDFIRLRCFLQCFKSWMNESVLLTVNSKRPSSQVMVPDANEVLVGMIILFMVIVLLWNKRQMWHQQDVISYVVLGPLATILPDSVIVNIHQVWRLINGISKFGSLGNEEELREMSQNLILKLSVFGLRLFL